MGLGATSLTKPSCGAQGVVAFQREAICGVVVARARGLSHGIRQTKPYSAYDLPRYLHGAKNLDLGWPRGFCGTDDRMHSNESGLCGKPGLSEIMVCAMNGTCVGLLRSIAFAVFRLSSKLRGFPYASSLVGWALVPRITTSRACSFIRRICVWENLMPSFWGALPWGSFPHIIRAISAPTPRSTYLNRTSTPLSIRQAADPKTNDNTNAARASFAAISLLCMLVMASFLGAAASSAI
ncbi:hypothetical protein KC358_g51 [Hortaea werneckii]|nr:hypothetical protein KC358_g51 [Hortaea werneckii]